MVTSIDPATTDVEEKTEVIYGEQNIIKDTIELIRRPKSVLMHAWILTLLLPL